MDLSAEVPTHFRSTGDRPGIVGLLREAVVEVFGRRRLIRYMVQADLQKKGTDTLLGNLWWVLDPLLQMVIYWILVSVIFQRGGPDYPLFLFSAILPWKWFQSSIQDGITSVSGAERLVRQIQFPKLVLPVSAVVAGIANFVFGLIPLFTLMLLLYRDRIELTLLLLPVVAAVQLVFNMGMTVLLSALNVFYRDIGNLARHVLRLWFYVSPALFTIDQLTHATESFPIVQRLLLLNPWATLFSAYHDVIYNGTLPDWSALGTVLLGSIAFLAVTTLVFKRLEPSFAKVL
ncbi:MAG TPA: ABC transporter permease [Candidatus Limnocylindrales bacterium]|nr:ABC transporter permease [Candidatus Limnocylindrales bacterium]